MLSIFIVFRLGYSLVRKAMALGFFWICLTRSSSFGETWTWGLKFWWFRQNFFRMGMERWRLETKGRIDAFWKESSERYFRHLNCLEGPRISASCSRVREVMGLSLWTATMEAMEAKGRDWMFSGVSLISAAIIMSAS